MMGLRALAALLQGKLLAVGHVGEKESCLILRKINRSFEGLGKGLVFMVRCGASINRASRAQSYHCVFEINDFAKYLKYQYDFLGRGSSL